MLDQLNRSGLGAQVGSWLGRGSNQPITAQDIEGALSDEHVQRIAQSLGIPADKVTAFLAAHLPSAVDRQSPDGTLEEPAAAPTEGDQA
jgi:uncharacterized protein YidB (DUF937 family)